VAFATGSLVRGAERFFPVMASPAILALGEGGLGHFGVALFHLKYLGMAIRTLVLLLGDVGLMAKRYRPQVASLGFELEITPADLFLLRVGHAHRYKAQDKDADDGSFEYFLAQIFASFPVDRFT
jgi:hypothetical protein